jgi:hypothetical protein
MFWDKKDDKNKLPDLPLPKNFSLPRDFESTGEIKPIRSFSPPNDDLNKQTLPESHALPSFSNPEVDLGFSQKTIKEAVNPKSSEEENFEFPAHPDFTSPKNQFQEKRFEIKELPEIPSQKEMPRFTRELKENPNLPKIPSSMSFPESDFSIQRPPMAHSTFKPVEKHDVFIRIDKFRAAKRSLNEIKSKVDDVDSLLKKIRETKMREEQELSGWESELTNIKTKIKDVTQNIFEKPE